MAMAIYQNDENIKEGERLHTVHGMSAGIVSGEPI